METIKVTQNNRNDNLLRSMGFKVADLGDGILRAELPAGWQAIQEPVKQDPHARVVLTLTSASGEEMARYRVSEHGISSLWVIR